MGENCTAFRNVAVNSRKIEQLRVQRFNWFLDGLMGAMRYELAVITLTFISVNLWEK